MWNQAAVYRRRRRTFGVSAALLVLLIIIALSSGGGSPLPQRVSTRANVVVPSAAPLTYNAVTRLLAPIRESAVAAIPHSSSFSLLGGLDSAGGATTGIATVDSGGTTVVGELPVLLYAAAAVELGGREYIFGGTTGQSTQPYIYGYSPLGSGEIKQAGELPQSSDGIAAAVTGHTVYLIGGYTGTTTLDTIQAWKGPGHLVKTVAHLPEGLRYSTAAAIHGEIVIAGGLAATGQPSKQVFVFDPAKDTLQLLTKLPVALYAASAATLGNRVYVMGGMQADKTPVSTIYSIDPSSTTAGSAGSLPNPISEASAVTIGDTIYLAGGWDGTAALNLVGALTAPAATTKTKAG